MAQKRPQSEGRKRTEISDYGKEVSEILAGSICKVVLSHKAILFTLRPDFCCLVEL